MGAAPEKRGTLAAAGIKLAIEWTSALTAAEGALATLTGYCDATSATIFA